MYLMNIHYLTWSKEPRWTKKIEVNVIISGSGLDKQEESIKKHHKRGDMNRSKKLHHFYEHERLLANS